MCYVGTREGRGRVKEARPLSISLAPPERRRHPPSISKTDEDFADDGIEFVWGSESINIGELNELFQKVGFPRRDPERLRLALDHTHTVLWIRAAKASRWARQHQLLGFARATSDGTLTATIWDVAVNPAWQRVGLGRALVERLVAELCRCGIDIISLYAEQEVVLLYEKLGFAKDVNAMSGMAFQKTSVGGRRLISAAVEAAAAAAGAGAAPAAAVAA